MPTDIRETSGLVATVCTTGFVQPEYSINFSNLRSYNDRNDLHKVEYRIFDAKLVEEGRDQVCLHALRNDYDWVLQIDADAAPFPADSLERMLRTAFARRPSLDVLGAYCQLKSRPFLATIDTGTGRWEPEPPNQGVLPVIRTGGHFLLIKTRILTQFGPPWFRTRKSVPPLKALKEVDNFARITLDGRNPLRDSSAWKTLEAEAQKGDTGEGSHIGEDSGFSDRVKSVGGHIAVDTGLVVGHVTKRVILPEDLKRELLEDKRRKYEYVGVRGYD